MKKIGLVLATVMLVVGLVVGGASVQAVAGDTIKIGAVLNFTGPIAFIGPLFKNGIEYALEEVNHTVGGKKIEMIYEDAANDMNMVLEKVKKLVERDKVHVIIGPLMGDAQLALAPYLKGKKVLISTLYCGMSPLVEYGNWLIYPTTVEGLTMPVGWYAADQGHKTMITMGADYAGGQGFIAGIKLGFEGRGGTIVQELWPPVGTKDYGPTISNMKKEADCVGYFLAGPTEQTLFIPQYWEFGMKMPLIGTTMAADLPANLLAGLGDRASELVGQALYIATMDTPANKAFQEGMNSQFGAYPGGLENNSYCVAKAILTGLEATGGDDSFDKLRPAVLASKIDTPQGPLAWTKSGIGLCNGYIAQAKLKDGTWIWDPIKVYKEVRDLRFED